MFKRSDDGRVAGLMAGRGVVGARGWGVGVLVGALVSVVVLGSGPAQAAEAESAVVMSRETRALLESMLNEAQMEALEATLSAEAAWGSLGPHPTGERRGLPVDEPGREIVLTIGAEVEGSGTAEDPYVDAISGFLAEQFEYEVERIEAYKGYPEAGVVDEYMSALSYEPTVVRVPAGHYRETARVYERPYRFHDEVRVGVDVPPGVWLKGEGEVVVQPAVEEGEGGALMNLNVRAGLVDVVLDGSTIPGFEPEPETRIHAVTAAHEAVLARNHIHDFTGRGITALGNRGREGSDVVVVDNIIETIGYSGISSQSRWLIRDNQIRYAGVLRPSGGGGDDGIIPRWGVEGEIVNNLVILERRPHARHVLSSQASRGVLYAGNISIAFGPTRNNIGLSDGAHENRLIGNVALTTGDPSDSAIQAGISVNGYGSVIRHNVSIGSVRAFRAIGRDDEALPMVSDNYAEYSKPGGWSSSGDFHRARLYEAERNTIKALEAHLPRPEVEAFGFFVRE